MVATEAVRSLSRLRGRVGVVLPQWDCRSLENTLGARELSPAALCERDNLSRKRERLQRVRGQ